MPKSKNELTKPVCVWCKNQGRLPNIYTKIIIDSRKVGWKGALWNPARASWFNNYENKIAVLDPEITTDDQDNHSQMLRLQEIWIDIIWTTNYRRITRRQNKFIDHSKWQELILLD